MRGEDGRASEFLEPEARQRSVPADGRREHRRVREHDIGHVAQTEGAPAFRIRLGVAPCCRCSDRCGDLVRGARTDLESVLRKLPCRRLRVCCGQGRATTKATKTHASDGAMRAYLMLIDRKPEAVNEVLILGGEEKIRVLETGRCAAHGPRRGDKGLRAGKPAHRGNRPRLSRSMKTVHKSH